MKKRRAFKKFSYRGVDLDKLLDMSHKEVLELLPARIRRRFSRGLGRKYATLLKKLRKAVSRAAGWDTQ
jgi:small subunit ribosomal protein S15e